MRASPPTVQDRAGGPTAKDGPETRRHCRLASGPAEDTATPKAHAEGSSAILAWVALVSPKAKTGNTQVQEVYPRAYTPQQLPESKVTGLDRSPEPGLLSWCAVGRNLIQPDSASGEQFAVALGTRPRLWPEGSPATGQGTDGAWAQRG